MGRPFSAQSGFLDATGMHNNARVVVKILGYEVIEHQKKFIVSLPLNILILILYGLFYSIIFFEFAIAKWFSILWLVNSRL